MAAPSCQGVYLIQSCNPRGKTIFKLGRSDDIKRRMKEYGPTWEILCCFPHDDSRDLEKFLIDRFRTELKIYANNEYFETSYSSSSIMKFFVDGVRYYTPAGKGSLSKPAEIPKPTEIMKLAPVPRPKPRRSTAGQRVRFKTEDPVPEPEPRLKIKGLNGMKETPASNPFYRIKIYLLNPEWPNMWKFSKKDFVKFVNEVVSQLKQGVLDVKYIKEQVWGFLDPLSVKKTVMNDICRQFESLDPKMITKKVIDELKE